ncbi:YitT family protein [Clostridium sp. MSJ-4]|uniref:YitT family protein n=1 Tax=Clostridium simiarum TaxID=2841506 RepID=A0ABS6F243_9CLOT|nr:YitT family protein [Clostridium simiarum]MBU5592579.1 YitT family protein [Clostridium simiarum]
MKTKGLNKKKIIKEYAFITFGIILVAIAVEYFFIPNNIAEGGVAGLSIVIHNYLPNISVEAMTLILNLILFIVGFLVLGGSFGLKTIYSALSLSVIMWIIKNLFNPMSPTNDLLLATIFGTLITATGLAIVFNQNSSTGGTDIIAKIINKYLHLDIGKALFSVDILVVLAGALTFGFEIGMYAFLSVILNGNIIDSVIDGFNACKQVMIVTEKHKEISEFIMKDLERGCTIFEGKGAYSSKYNSVLYTVLGRREFIKLKNFIKESDPKAFITVNEVKEVLGEGFREM